LPLALIILPLAQQLLRGNQAVWIPSPDVVGFSPDALGYFLPSVDNPLIRATPLAPFVVKVVPYQYSFLIYAGWVPMLLALIGGWSQPAKNRAWAILAIGGAILALGPLLKAGGDYVRVIIGQESYRVVMPYAIIMNWPFIQWSRTPGRLTVLVMLAMAVLATLGLQRLLKRLPAGRWAWLVVGLVTAGTTVEYWVRFPFPSYPASYPAVVKSLRAASDRLAVLQVPINSYQDNQRALYWQTVHQHPLVGGRVYRDDADANRQYNFYGQLLLEPGSQTVVNTRLQALASGGVGWVLYDAAADPGGEVGALLKARLGPPLAEDHDSALYQLSVKALGPGSSFWETSANWEPPAGGASGQHFCREGEMGLMAANTMVAQLAFDARPAAEPRRLTVVVNHQTIGRYLVGDEAAFYSQPVTLTQGYNAVELVDEGPLAASQGAQVALALCTPAGQAAFTWSPAISNLAVHPSETPAAAPIATFGSEVQLTSLSMAHQAHPGETLPVHVVLRVVAPVNDDLTLFVHVLDANNRLAAQIDAPPLGDSYPTSRWQPGEVVATSLRLTLPSDLTGGDYQLGLGVYRQADLQRLEVTGADAPDGMLRLGVLKVTP
jgi:hypothetical protein